MDLTKLPSIAKFKVGDTVIYLDRPARIVARFWSHSRQNIVYNVQEITDGHGSISYRVGEGLLKAVPKKEMGWED
ncbi:MAG: hypothetical protein JNL43_14855 [Flavobacteriales bacterium]|nr:hypothetical protein [Flavobacteriales bacterium]